MAYSSATGTPILNPIAGGCWAWRQLRNGIKDISVASKPRKSLTLVRVVFIYTLAIPPLDGRFLNNHCSDAESDSGRLLRLTPASQRYRIHLCRIKTQEVAVFCRDDLYRSPGDTLLDGRYLHNRWPDFDSVCERLLGMMPAFQRYRVRLCRTKAHEFAVFCGGCIRYQAGDTLLDGGLPKNCWTESDSLCGRLLGSTPASQRYKVRLCRIKAQEFTVFCGGCIRYPAAVIYLTADMSTTSRRILMLFAGGCWA